MTKLTQAFNKAVCKYMIVETELAKADVAFVFGNRDHAEYLAEHAAELYKKGYFNKVLLSGGALVGDVSEAERMRKVMLSRGVPDEALIIEDQARNTGENVSLGMKLLDKEIGLKNIKSILAVGQIQASRRFMMTLERHWPEVIKMFSTCNQYPLPVSKWHGCEKMMPSVREEFNKVAPYKKQGFLAEVDIAKINTKVKTIPQPGEKGNF